MSTVAPEDAAVLAIPDLPIPSPWLRVLDAWPELTAPSDVIDGIRRATETGLLAQAVTERKFIAELQAALSGPSKSAVITYARSVPALPVVSLVGALLGDVSYPADEDLGGPASVVPTGGIDRYEQAWHTDSTPWNTPNRWSVLGVLHEDPALERPTTSVLPWAYLATQWQDDGELRKTLTEHRFSWREQYDRLPPLHAPILGDVPRWFRPALAGLIESPESRATPCAAVDTALSQATTWYEAEVSSGRVLVFDNHAVLHRGPAVRKPSTRTLARLKVDGVPFR